MHESASERTFLFADLSGFTALTEAHGDEGAAQMAERFFETVRELLAEHSATEVKTIGDAAMLCCPSAADAIKLGLRIVEKFWAHPDLPSVRVGVNTGPAVERNGDWFGAAVNVAARVSGAAAGGELLISKATLTSAGQLDGIELRSEGEKRFHNVGDPVRVYRALRRGPQTPGLPIDPVCRMAVDPSREIGKLGHHGHEYHFCSLACASAFAGDPERYLAEDPVE